MPRLNIYNHVVDIQGMETQKNAKKIHTRIRLNAKHFRTGHHRSQNKLDSFLFLFFSLQRQHCVRACRYIVTVNEYSTFHSEKSQREKWNKFFAHWKFQHNSCLLSFCWVWQWITTIPFAKWYLITYQLHVRETIKYHRIRFMSLNRISTEHRVNDSDSALGEISEKNSSMLLTNRTSFFFFAFIACSFAQ